MIDDDERPVTEEMWWLTVAEIVWLIRVAHKSNRDN